MAQENPIALVLGAEEYLADRAITGLTREWIANDPTSTSQTISASGLEVGEITDLTAPSLFGERRCLILRDAEDLTAAVQQELATYLANPEPDLLLIIAHRSGAKGKAVVDLVKKAGASVITVTPVKKEGEKLDFVRAEFAGAGRKIAADAVKALVDAVGSDLRELAAACSQLLADTQGQVTAAMVERYHSGRIEATGFKVADAAVEGRSGEALATLRHALATGTDPVLVTSALASALRTLAKVGSAPRGAQGAALASQLGLAPWQVDKARRQLTGWDGARITTAITAIALADAAVKGADADPIHALERAVLTIAAARG
jgi:DNA polymerase III subunit delta